MGLSRYLASWAVRRPHVLLAEVPGWWHTRVAVERAADDRGWRLAVSPADADVLVTCGRPGARLAEAVDRVWDQLPGPRARVTVTDLEAAPALDAAARWLLDDERQVLDARSRRSPARGDVEPPGHAHHHAMTAPAGIPLAGERDDRDGLRLDALHLPLGPVLPQWPAGLVLHCALHGDVVADAEVETLHGVADAAATPPFPRAAALDAAARLLALTGWNDAAATARRLRDLVLDARSEPEHLARRIDQLRARVTRSRLLRWLLRGLGTVDTETLRRHRLPTTARGDVHDRLAAILTRAAAGLRGEAEPTENDPGAVRAALPAIVTGLELGAVRLVVASLEPDITTLRSEPSRG